MATYCRDLDETPCSNTTGAYHTAQPRMDAISAVNELFDKGHRVLVYTALGSGTGINWRSVSERQLSMLGLKAHELRLGKSEAEIYIDDEAVKACDWDELGNAVFESTNEHHV